MAAGASDPCTTGAAGGFDGRMHLGLCSAVSDYTLCGFTNDSEWSCLRTVCIVFSTPLFCGVPVQEGGLDLQRLRIITKISNLCRAQYLHRISSAQNARYVIGVCVEPERPAACVSRWDQIAHRQAEGKAETTGGSSSALQPTK